MPTIDKNYAHYHYERAPLQEAIFEVKFFDESFDAFLPGRFFDRVSSKFPVKKTITNIFISNQPISGSNPPQFPQSPAIQVWNTEQNRCLQVGQGILAANEMAYTRWEHFENSIKFLLDKYFECAIPSAIQRIGYRCINRVLIPKKNVFISDYFKLDFSLPTELLNPNGLGLSISNEIQFEDIDLTTNVKFSSDTLKKNEDGVAFILDIDVFSTENIQVDKQSIIKSANNCHLLEKIIFESLLKDELRKLLGACKL